MEDSSWIYRLGPRGTSRKPVPCSQKWADWCLMSPVLSAGGVGGGLGWWLSPLIFRFESGVASPELSVGDVDTRSVCPLLFDLGLAVWTPCLLK